MADWQGEGRHIFVFVINSTWLGSMPNMLIIDLTCTFIYSIVFSLAPSASLFLPSCAIFDCLVFQYLQALVSHIKWAPITQYKWKWITQCAWQSEQIRLVCPCTVSFHLICAVSDINLSFKKLQLEQRLEVRNSKWHIARNTKYED